jgi:hypothetical protein
VRFDALLRETQHPGEAAQFESLEKARRNNGP